MLIVWRRANPSLSIATLTELRIIAKVRRPDLRSFSLPTMSATKTAPEFSAKRLSPKIWGQMPVRIKVLYITTLHRTGGWLAEAFRADCAAEVLLVETVGVTAGLSHLRDEVFDAVLVSHEPGVLDALDLVEGLRAGGNDEPMIVLGASPSAQMAAVCYEVGADAYCCVAETTTRSLLWTFARAIERCQLVREHRRLVQNGAAAIGTRTSRSGAAVGRAAGTDCGAGEDSRETSRERESGERGDP